MEVTFVDAVNVNNNKMVFSADHIVL